MLADHQPNLGIPLVEQRFGFGLRRRLRGESNLQTLPTAGEERQRRIAGLVESADQRIEALVEPALALAPRAQRAADDHAGVARSTTQVGQHGALDHLLHLVRHTGHRVDDLVDAVDRDGTDQARRRAASLRDDRLRRPAPCAWRRLLAAMYRPREANMLVITSATASS